MAGDEDETNGTEEEDIVVLSNIHANLDDVEEFNSVTYTNATKDEVGFRGSSTRVGKKTKLEIFQEHFRHPYFRIFVSYFVILCNFIIYAEDPVAHSRARCEIPVVGNAFSMVFTKYPPNGFSALKFFMWLIALVLGIVVGKLILHTWLLNKKLNLGMFTHDQGSWMICFFLTIIMILISSAIYNLFLSLDSTMKPYTVNGYVGASNQIFMRAAALGTWFGDFITAWMVTDMMLQETDGRYEHWLPKVRQWWVTPPYRRIIAFWAFSVILTIVVIVAVCTSFINWDKFNRDVVYTNELGRAFLASFILVMDFTIVMQDWDFPKFQSELDIKLPGVNTSHFIWEFPDWVKKNFVIHITGKWFQYGILFMVLILDLNMWKNQIFYEPLLYAQYTGDDGHIFSVYDAFSLANEGNKTIFSYDWRNSTIDPTTSEPYIKADYKTNSRYRGYKLSAKATAFIPSIAVFIVFGLLIYFFGRLNEEERDALSPTPSGNAAVAEPSSSLRTAASPVNSYDGIQDIGTPAETPVEVITDEREEESEPVEPVVVVASADNNKPMEVIPLDNPQV